MVRRYNKVPTQGKKRKGRKRLKYTKEEDDAIKRGIETIGPGRWADIKVRYENELRRRSNVQIKDRWREIAKRDAR